MPMRAAAATPRSAPSATTPPCSRSSRRSGSRPRGTCSRRAPSLRRPARATAGTGRFICSAGRRSPGAQREVAPDEAQRQAAIHARGVNVVADAGAGTGKTTLLVARLVELVAPADDGPAVPLPRVAAITFTRNAAGELKL